MLFLYFISLRSTSRGILPENKVRGGVTFMKMDTRERKANISVARPWLLGLDGDGDHRCLCVVAVRNPEPP
jgi:hypothetical protein